MTTPEEVEEAVKVGMNAIGCLDFCDPNEKRDVGDTDAAYPILSKMGPFLKCAMVECEKEDIWGAHSVYTKEAKQERLEAYRALMAPPEVKDGR